MLVEKGYRAATLGDRRCPMLSVVVGWDVAPMWPRARGGHGRRGPTALQHGGDGHKLNRRGRPVRDDHLPRWQAAPAARQVTERITRPGEGISPEIKTAGDQLGA
jgi:hypothetical protein